MKLSLVLAETALLENADVEMDKLSLVSNVIVPVLAARIALSQLILAMMEIIAQSMMFAVEHLIELMLAEETLAACLLMNAMIEAAILLLDVSLSLSLMELHADLMIFATSNVFLELVL